MIGHRLGHLNFTLYRKQRRPPNHGVNVNDARIRKPFRRTRKLNDNDILHRRCAEILIRLENILFFLLSLPFFVIHLFLSSFQLRNFASFFLPPPPPLPHLPLFFHIFVSVLRSFGRCVFCSVKILVNSNHDSRVLYRGTGTDFSLFPGLNKSLEVGCGGGRARANGGLLLLFFLGVPRWIVLLINVRGCRWNNQRMTL